MNNLPSKIMKMVAILHEKGYCDVYLHCGLSPSGMNWRFRIGKIKNYSWPNYEVFVSGSVSDTGIIEWSEDQSSAEGLADDFENYYDLSKSEQYPLYVEYNKWYSELLKMLKENEILVFYADYEAPHEYLLKYAPGYQSKNL